MFKLITINDGVETEVEELFEEKIGAEFYAEGIEPEAYKIIPVTTDKERKLQEVIDYLKLHEGYDKNEVISDLLAKVKATGKYSADEIGLSWDEKNLTDLESFAHEFYDLIIESVCNVVKSFKES